MKILRQIAINLTGIILIFFVNLLFRYPVLINSDYFWSHDEAFMAFSILELINGGPLFLFYEGVNYHGVLGGITAIPFMWLFGIGSLAYKLPAIFYYSLYVWSTFLIARQIAPRISSIVILIMLFPPDSILAETFVNHPHTEICFIGNILLFLFIKIKTKDAAKCIDIFLLGVVMGFAIYSYTYAILHVFTILFIFFLTHERWESLQNNISLDKILGLFTNLSSKRYVLVRILDALILLFLFGVLFSYVFGGFGLDIGGNSILQINELHKPVFQMMIILVLRLIIRRDDVLALLRAFSQWIQILKPNTKRNCVFGCFGFLIGLSPRILAIISGVIKSGGQGFDVDFLPSKLVLHFWSLITQTIPMVLGVYHPLEDWGLLLNYQPFVIILGLISLYILFGILLSLVLVVASQKENLLNVFKLKKTSFDPILVLVIFSVLTLVAVVVSQSGPLPRYLYPMFGVLAIFLALVLDKIREISGRTFFVLMFVWVGFYSSTAYMKYLKVGVVDGVRLVKLAEYPLHSVLRFFQSKNIKTVYSSVYYSSALSFFSRGELVGTEYQKSTRGKKKKVLASVDPDFAILINEIHTDDIRKFRAITVKNNVSYQTKIIKTFHVFFKFKGDENAINGLRSFVG